MRILFYLGHPAHFYVFRNLIKILEQKNNRTIIVIKKKDILEELLNNAGLKYINILPGGRKNNKVSIAFALLKRDINLFRIANSFKPNIMLGTSAEITHIGKIKNIPSIVVNEDDADVVPFFSYMSYPFADHILTPSSCRVGKWHHKAIFYEGNHELAYLHPNYFKPNKTIVNNILNKNNRFFILRFAKLTAHHDKGRGGLTREITHKIINLLKPYGSIYITSERELEQEFEQYRIHINPLDIHHFIYFADMYIGDSQTMAAEAAVLGTPSIRFNDFVGELSYLEELEHRYQLTYGIKTDQVELLCKKIKEFLKTDNLKKEWASRRKKMLAENVDITKLMLDIIENYPRSISKYKNTKF